MTYAEAFDAAQTVILNCPRYVWLDGAARAAALSYCANKHESAAINAMISSLHENSIPPDFGGDPCDIWNVRLLG